MLETSSQLKQSQAKEMPELVLFHQPIINIRQKNATKIYEILIRWKKIGPNEPIIDAKTLLDSAEKIKYWLEMLDIEIISTFFRQYKEWKFIHWENDFHININPLTLLDDYYWNILERILREESYNIFYHPINLLFEIIEINKDFSIEEITKLNSRIKQLKESYGLKVWIDDFPILSNDPNMIQNIKWINFVKIDKSVVLDYTNWKIWKDDFILSLQSYIDNIKLYHPDSTIVVEWIEEESVFNLIKEKFPEITHFQWYYFWKPIELKCEKN